MVRFMSLVILNVEVPERGALLKVQATDICLVLEKHFEEFCIVSSMRKVTSKMQAAALELISHVRVSFSLI